jgi:hypothetical protein
MSLWYFDRSRSFRLAAFVPRCTHLRPVIVAAFRSRFYKRLYRLTKLQQVAGVGQARKKSNNATTRTTTKRLGHRGLRKDLESADIGLRIRAESNLHRCRPCSRPHRMNPRRALAGIDIPRQLDHQCSGALPFAVPETSLTRKFTRQAKSTFNGHPGHDNLPLACYHNNRHLSEVDFPD